MKFIFLFKKFLLSLLCNQTASIMKTKRKYLIALPSFPRDKGFCHPTILVSAVDEADAIDLARYLKPRANIGSIKEVNY
jgi:hypothetical protein